MAHDDATSKQAMLRDSSGESGDDVEMVDAQGRRSRALRQRSSKLNPGRLIWRNKICVTGWTLLFFSLLGSYMRHSASFAGRCVGEATNMPSFVAFESEIVTENGSTDGLEPWLGSRSRHEDGFTIMVPTYKRPAMLPTFLDNYATGDIPSLRRIVIMWHDSTTEPEPSLLYSLASYPVPVVLERRPKSLNYRFRRSKNVQTDCVFSIDDDMLYDAADVELGYQSWRQFGLGRKRMVGYISRQVIDGQYVMVDFESYSIVLTKCAFFHIDWLDAYWSSDTTMVALRSFVNEHHNCEDILMSFLHARYTRLPPVEFLAPFEDKGLKDGISTRPGHLNERTFCVQHFLDVFGQDTLVSTELSLAKH